MENLSLVAGELSPPKPKNNRTEYFNEYNNRPEIKEKRRLERLERERQKQKEREENDAKIYEAESIKVLFTLKEYTEQSVNTRKKWANFVWTFNELKKYGFHDIIPIMKFREEADNLIRDYWEKGKNEIKKGRNHWNILDYDQQQRIVKYWGREKARKEQKLAETLQQQTEQGKTYEKEIEIAKYHEERGKIRCECWQCEEQKKIKAEVKAEREKIIKDYEAEQIKAGEIGSETIRAECVSCYEYKKVDSDSGLCQKCSVEEGGEI